MTFDTISVIGLGYIGLPTAAVLPPVGTQGHRRGCQSAGGGDINRGKIHIVEPELDMLVHSAVHEGICAPPSTPEPADAFLIAVPTPFKREEGNEMARI